MNVRFDDEDIKRIAVIMADRLMHELKSGETSLTEGSLQRFIIENLRTWRELEAVKIR